jgi:hypothetical protein
VGMEVKEWKEAGTGQEKTYKNGKEYISKKKKKDC